MSFAARFARNLTASRGIATRAIARPAVATRAAVRQPQMLMRQYSSAHEEETFEEFTARYEDHRQMLHNIRY